MKKMKQGFTLIELLIVIAIIGILASIVLVSLSSAREKAKVASFKAAAHSIQSAAIMACDSAALTSNSIPVNNASYVGNLTISSNSCGTSGNGTFSIAVPSTGLSNTNCSATVTDTGVTFSNAC